MELNIYFLRFTDGKIIMFLFSMKHAYLFTTQITPDVNNFLLFFSLMLTCILSVTFSVLLWPQLNWYGMYMLRHSFASTFLQEILIIVILIFCLNLPASKCLNFHPHYSWKVYHGINEI